MIEASVPKLPSIDLIPYDVRKLIKEEFMKAIQSLKRVKSTINPDERQLLLYRTRALSLMATKYHIELSEAEIGTCALLFKQLIEFDSPRVLI